MTDLYKLFFHQSNDPGFVIDLETQRLREVNEAFTQLTGWTQEDVAAGNYTTRDLVADTDLDLFDDKTGRRHSVTRERYEIRILNQDGDVRHVEVSVATVDHDGASLVIGSLRDITAQKRLERTLQNEISRQRNMTYKAAQASVRIGQVLEKLRSVPALARALLSSESREQLLTRVVGELSAGDKFSYARVMMYVKPSEGDRTLVLVADSENEPPAGGGEAAQDPISVALTDVPHVARAIAENQLVSDGLTYAIPVHSRHEIAGALLVQFHEFEKNLFDENTTIRRAQQDTVKTIGNLVGLGLENLDLYRKLQHQALFDELTGLNNRRHFERCVEDYIATAEEAVDTRSIVLLDVDHFKGINDRFGHHAGDRALIKVAELLQQHFEFAAATCRFGGDEFAILAPGAVTEIAGVAEELRKAVAASGWDLDDVEPTRLTVSIGVASFDTRVTPRTWLLEVDQALYRAKQAGRNRVEVTHPAPAL